MPEKIPLLILHHANQYLVTDGYDNRDGISTIADGYAAVLHLHETYRIPCYLHFSGTLIETLAWHRPALLQQVRALRDRGLVRMVGGTYSENIMTCFDGDFNRRQLREYLRVFEMHLGRADELKIFWVPERVWSTGSLASVLSDPSLANGGYSTVVLDRRLCFPVESKGLTRGRVDKKGPWNIPATSAVVSPSEIFHDFSPKEREEYFRSFGLHSIAGTSLRMLPICENLRYWIPPRSAQDYDRLKEWAAATSSAPNPLLVFADDLERVAGVGGWDKSALQRFEQFMRWMGSGEAPLQARHLDESSWPREDALPLDDGTFFELAHPLQAGEDYRRWSENDDNQAAKSDLESSLAELRNLGAGEADPDLLDLAWKHVMASAYETYWHEDPRFGFKTSPWAAALASHSRQARVMLAAARWFASSERPLVAQETDVNRDGETEIVLKNRHLFAVLTAEHGGRLTWLFWKNADENAKLMIGNPTDDWNFQSDLNSHMRIPANHPGAFCDRGEENDRYAVVKIENSQERAQVTLKNAVNGRLKIFTLTAEAMSLEVTYARSGAERACDVVFALSPDYAGLLRGGRQNLDRIYQSDQVMAARGEIALILSSRSQNGFFTATPDVGHGLGVRFSGKGETVFTLLCRKVK